MLPYDLGQVLLTNHLPLTRQPGFANLAGQELAALSPQLPHRHLHILTARARQQGVGKELDRQHVPHLSSVNEGADRVVRELGRRTRGTALGSAGFMQGVDIRDLSVVSLDRLPFPIPDVVLSQQRVALGDFEQFWNRVYLPRAVLKFVQAFGRLVRDDRREVGARRIHPVGQAPGGQPLSGPLSGGFAGAEREHPPTAGPCGDVPDA